MDASAGRAAGRASEASTPDSLGGIRTKDGGVWPQRSAPELSAYEGGAAREAHHASPAPASVSHANASPTSSPQRGSAKPSESPVRAPSTTGALAVSSIPTKGIVQQDARAMLNHLQTCSGGVNAVDAAGWSCLHWASLEGKEEHVAALLDSGAEATLTTTLPVDDERLPSGVRDAGTTASTLARFPGGEGGSGKAKSHPRIVKLLSAAERGAFRLRREYKELGDAAMAASDFPKAVEMFEKVLGAVLQLEDTAAMTVRSALSLAEEAVQRQEEEALARAEAERTAARRAREEAAVREEEERTRRELAMSTLRDAEAALGDTSGGKDGHVSRALETLEPLMSGEVCMEDVRDFLWRVAARLQGQLRVSETRSAQRQDVTQHRSLLRRNIDEGS